MNCRQYNQVYPRGVEKQVERIRQAQAQKQMQQDDWEKKARGEAFDKLKLHRYQPPKLHQPAKKDLLLYVNINITPSKKGRIGIYAGDDLKVVAKNFCRTFNLNRTVQDTVEEHLRESYRRYLTEHGN